MVIDNIRCALSHNSHALLHVHIPAAYGARHHAYRPCTPASCWQSPAVCSRLSWYLPLERTPGRMPYSAAVRCACASLATTDGRCCLCRAIAQRPCGFGYENRVYLSCAGVVCIIESSCGQAWTERYRFDARVSVLLFSRTTHASKGGIICHVRHEAMTMQCRHSYSREVTRLHQALGSIPGRHEIPLHHSRRSLR